MGGGGEREKRRKGEGTEGKPRSTENPEEGRNLLVKAQGQIRGEADGHGGGYSLALGVR